VRESPYSFDSKDSPQPHLFQCAVFYHPRAWFLRAAAEVVANKETCQYSKADIRRDIFGQA
jgi:hypothetical protein